jgi:hypothetical protein
VSDRCDGPLVIVADCCSLAHLYGPAARCEPTKMMKLLLVLSTKYRSSSVKPADELKGLAWRSYRDFIRGGGDLLGASLFTSLECGSGTPQ